MRRKINWFKTGYITKEELFDSMINDVQLYVVIMDYMKKNKMSFNEFYNEAMKFVKEGLK